MRSDAKYPNSAARSKAYYEKNKKKVLAQMWAKALSTKYGITVDIYQDMLIEQNGVCKICNKPETLVDKRYGTLIRLAVDHDHETGKVRGLLCNNCNRMLGFVKDDTALLMAMYKYIRAC